MSAGERVYPEDGWWRVAFVLDKEITEELQVGQPVSIGVSEWKWGSISLDEVSVVRRGAVRGAEVVERFEARPRHCNLVPGGGADSHGQAQAS